MATIVKEGRVEAKGYPLTGGGVQKNSKKLNLQLTSDGLLSFLDSGKAEYSIQLNCYVEVGPDTKKKRLSITVDSDTTIIVEPDDDVSAWLEQIAKCTPPKYFGAELSSITRDQQEIPQLIEHALQALEKHMDVDGLFRISGSKPDIETLRKLYDSNQRPNNLLHYDVHTVTGVLKLYLRQLPNPLVPFSHYNQVIGLSNNSDIPGSFASILAEFPLQHQVVLKAICLFMQRVGLQSSVNQMTHSNLAIVVAPNLMRPAVESLETATHSQHIIPVFAAVFEHADKIFAGVAGGSAKASPAGGRSRPVSMGFATPPSLPQVPSSIANRDMGIPPPSLGAIPETSSSEQQQPPARRPVSMAVPGGIGSVMAAGPKLPPIPAGGAKKALRPTPPVGGPPVGGGGGGGGGSGSSSSGTSPTDNSANPLLGGHGGPGVSSGGPPQFQLPAVHAGGPPGAGVGGGGPKKMPFMGQMAERTSNLAQSSGPGAAPDGIGAVSKSVSLSGLPKTSPAFGKRAAVVPLAIPEDHDAPPALGTPQTPPSLAPSTSGSDLAAKKESLTVPGSSEEDAARDAEAAQWKSYENDDGRTYYHNETTGVTQWDKPDCLKKRVKKHRKGNSSTISKEELMGTTSASSLSASSGAVKDSPMSTPTTTSTSSTPLTSSTPARVTPSKRKTDRAQTTTAAPNMAAVNAIAASLPSSTIGGAAGGAGQTSGMAPPSGPSLPPPVSSLPPVMPTPVLPPSLASSGPKTDAERINTLEYKVAALEKLVADQAKLIEQLLGSRS